MHAVRLGLQEFDRGNYEEARARFLEAHRIYPNARSLRSLGKVEYELKNYAASIHYLERALDSRTRPLSTDLRTDVQSLLELARGYVGTYTIHLQPDWAQLEVDGERMSLSEEGQLTMEVGEHVLSAHAEGYRPARKSVEVVGGEDKTVELQLLPLPEPAQPDEQAGSMVDRGGRGRNRGRRSGGRPGARAGWRHVGSRPRPWQRA